MRLFPRAELAACWVKSPTVSFFVTHGRKPKEKRPSLDYSLNKSYTLNVIGLRMNANQFDWPRIERRYKRDRVEGFRLRGE